MTGAGGRPDAGGETILVVEDDADVRAFVVAALGGFGYDIVEAADGPSALALLETGRAVDLLFTDIVLPGGMNGRELAEQAGKHRPGIAVVYTSGYAANALIHNGRLDAGVTLLAKPYARDALARAIRDALDRNAG